MNVTEALSLIHAPKGVTTIIGAAQTGDFAPILRQDASDTPLTTAREKLARVREQQRRCSSDWAYWGYAGDVAYWSAAVAILEAAEIVGPENLPDVPAPQLEGRVVMDACSEVRRFGGEVLRLAKLQVAS